MKYNVMKKWVKALRSGKYKQTQGALKHSDSYCCLGVLCEISNLGEFEGPTYVTPTDENYVSLPRPVMEYAGMEKTAGGESSFRCEVSHRPKNLLQMNDSGKTFKEIADTIEKNYKKL